ncbi:hypothetical protein EDWATA_01919 [Edwardsiella tarda ATCC 23685]|uniref:Uncharacterized protein n=1 Tax=Edwardsiella tarda ATCC 23685 TaxID=500638 RepID=D4F591_EDWTA|nr:hypothetical protein EDWATA_01919 [Edwardsiella tarda ATCC 23685]
MNRPLLLAVFDYFNGCNTNQYTLITFNEHLGDHSWLIICCCVFICWWLQKIAC